MKILVVDDNAGILEETVEMLERLGYRALAASSGEEALSVLEREHDIDLLLTDMVMPGALAGRALAATAVKLRPGLKILFASGYFEGDLPQTLDLGTDAEFLAKPYRMRDLAQKIERMLKATS